MIIHELIAKGKTFSHAQYQRKIQAFIPEKKLFQLGAQKIGTFIQEDSYYRAGPGCAIEGTIRLRKDMEDKCTFTYKSKSPRLASSPKMVIDKNVSDKQIKRIEQECQRIIKINKKRIAFMLNTIRINLDQVEGLGYYVELETHKKSDLSKINFIMGSLGLSKMRTTTSSYLELAMKNLSPLKKLSNQIHEKFGRLVFGISSATLTTLGILVGLDAATSSEIAVIGGIASVAVADSLSDSLSMYASKKSERGSSQKNAIKSAFATFLGKFIFSLTFMIPILLFSLKKAVFIDLLWGLILLVLVNIQIAYFKEENITKEVMLNLLIAAVVIILSSLTGRLIAILIGTA